MSPINLSRRGVLKGAGVLMLGVHLPGVVAHSAAAGGNSIVINAWLKISTDTTTVLVASSELGQGVFTALPMLVAEELGVDWKNIRVEMAPYDPVYANPLLGAMRTGGSTSVRAFFLPLRRAGAAARLMMLVGASRIWRVPIEQLVAEDGIVTHAASDRRASYGALAQLASRQKVPADPPLRERNRWTVIGKSLPRLDIPAKVKGDAVFGIDIRLPGQTYAAIRHCPVFGGSLSKLDESALKPRGGAYPTGIIAVVSLKDAVAVVADSWWQARSALGKLVITWKEGVNANITSNSFDSVLGRDLDSKDPKAIAVNRGDVDLALKGAYKIVESVYRQPFLAHATLEPMNCTANVTPNSCELWVPTQDQSAYCKILPDLLGLGPDQIKINTSFVGGSFGRRLESDFGVEAALLSKAVGRPVQLIWSREEDMRHDFYRPASLTRAMVGLDSSGYPVGWIYRIAAPSVLARVSPDSVRGGLDAGAVAGISDQPYGFSAVRVEYVRSQTGIPVGFWRSNGHAPNAFAMESLIDEAAFALSRDPCRFRRALLTKSPRALAVLNKAAELAGWDEPLAEVLEARRGRGIAFHEAFGSAVAEVVEVTVFADGRLKLDRVVGVIDCGTTVNPDIVAAQLEGAILFGLSAALTGRITVDNGRVVQGNFNDYPLLTLAEAPRLVVHVMASDGPPGGVSEAGVPPIAPALTNAIFTATGRRLRALPIAGQDIRSL
ncbi:MAG: molybdopterin cofactor-binding domain-containing protein [Rhodospirillaceae bacterium]